MQCPDGMVAIGGGVEAATNLPVSTVIGAPNEYPGRSQNPWVSVSAPVGPGVPVPNESFDFTTGEFEEPAGAAGAPTGWYGESVNGRGGTRVYAICSG